MSPMKSLARTAILPVLLVVLLAAGGCGNGSYPLDPEGGEKLKQARITAYGKSGIQSARGASSATPRDLSGQASARQRAQGNR